MAKFEDLTGRTFGRLTVISRAPNQGKKTMWNCRCNCKDETIITVAANSLKRGRTQSCGCLARELLAQRSTTHGKSKERIYHTWCDIKDRCNNPNRPAYKTYGARGITVAPEWENDFDAFYNYVSKLPHFGEKGYSLDRIDNDSGYEPCNLRFATPKEQGRNRRTNIWVEYNGEEMCLKDAAAKSGVPYKTLHHRYKVGDRGERLFRPINKKE